MLRFHITLPEKFFCWIFGFLIYLKLALDVMSWALYLIFAEGFPEGLLLQSPVKKYQSSYSTLIYQELTLLYCCNTACLLAHFTSSVYVRP